MALYRQSISLWFYPVQNGPCFLLPLLYVVLQNSYISVKALALMPFLCDIFQVLFFSP